MTTAKKTSKRTTKPKAKEPEVPDLTMADVLGRKVASVADCTICLDSRLAQRRDSLAQEVAELQASIDRREALAQRTSNPGAAASTEEFRRLERLEADLADATAEATENSVRFVFRALGKTRMSRLYKEHPPTKAQLAEFASEVKDGIHERGARLRYNPETLPPVLFHLAAVSPEMSEEQAAELWNSDEWSEGELVTILSTAWIVNESVFS